MISRFASILAFCKPHNLLRNMILQVSFLYGIQVLDLEWLPFLFIPHPQVIMGTYLSRI